jgi:ribosome maturation factor RimP
LFIQQNNAKFVSVIRPVRAFFVCMNQIDENIKELVGKVVENSNFLLVDLILRGTEQKRVVEVYIDGEKDITADDCALVSGEIDSQMKELLVRNPDYRLEVSSPGVDRPLKYLKQYYKHVNRKFEISYRSAQEVKNLSGKLASIDGEYLTFLSNNKEIIINFNSIIKAKVIISFS